jgi:hypothetical protein
VRDVAENLSSDSDIENYVDDTVSFSTSENNEKVETDVIGSEYF